MKPEKALIVQPANVNETLALIDKRLKSMKDTQTSKWLTPGKLTMLGGIVDVKSEQSIEKLAKAFANVIFQIQALEESYKQLGIKEYPAPQVDGGTLKDWKHDIKLRIAIINQKDEREELLAIKNGYTELMSNDDKKLILNQRLEKFLSKSTDEGQQDQ